MSETENKMEDECEPGSEIKNKNDTEPSAPPNSPEGPEDEVMDQGEIKMCSLCHKSIDPDLKIKWSCKHFVHKDCALAYLIKKQSCSPCLSSKKKRKEHYEQKKLFALRNYNGHRNFPQKISPELFKFFKRDYDAEMTHYNETKIPSFWGFLTADDRPEEPDERMSRKAVYDKIIDYCLNHKLIRINRILVNKNPRLRKLLGYPMKGDKNHLTRLSLVYYIEEHFIED
jgi:hypothetical protein